MVDLGAVDDGWENIHQGNLALKRMEEKLVQDKAAVSPDGPYLGLAKREAEDDQLLGIERNEDWVLNRAKDIAREDMNRKESDPKKINKKGRWIDREKLIEELDKTLEGKYGNKEKNWLASWLSTSIKQAIEKDRIERPVDVILKERAEKDIALIKRELSIKSDKERMKQARMTLTFMMNMMLAISIPVIGIFTHGKGFPWDLLQFIPLIIIGIRVRKPLMEMRKMMKDLEKETKSPDVEAIP